MSEITFCRAFLSALDSRPAKLSSDHIADARQYPSGAIFTLPRLAHPPHPLRPSAPTSTSSTTPPSTTPLSITLKPLKPTHPTTTFTPATAPAKTSIYDLKSHYATTHSLPPSKVKILYRKKPVPDSKTVAEVVGADAGAEVEFGVMVMGGATAAAGSAGSTPVTSPPAVAPSEAEKGLGGAPMEGVEVEESGAGPAAQGPSGKEVVAEPAFWDDLKGFLVQRTRDEAEGERLVALFKGAWEQSK